MKAALKSQPISSWIIGNLDLRKGFRIRHSPFQFPTNLPEYVEDLFSNKSIATFDGFRTMISVPAMFKYKMSVSAAPRVCC